MTCIVGLEHDGRAWIGADSFIGGGNTVDSIREPKAYRSGDVLMGHSGSYRRMCALRVSDLKFGSGIWTERRVTTQVVPQMIKILDDYGLCWLTNDTDESGFGSTILAVGGRVFEICPRMSVSRSRHGYSAIGSGCPSALGSLASTAGMDPRKRVQKALEAAERHTPSVRKPWKILEGR